MFKIPVSYKEKPHGRRASMVHKIKSCESEPECGAAISSPGILTAFFRIGDQKEKKEKNSTFSYRGAPQKLDKMDETVMPKKSD